MPGDAAKALRASAPASASRADGSRRPLRSAVRPMKPAASSPRGSIGQRHVRQGARRSCEHGGKRVHAASLRAS